MQHSSSCSVPPVLVLLANMCAQHNKNEQVQRTKHTRGMASNKGLIADEQARKSQEVPKRMLTLEVEAHGLPESGRQIHCWLLQHLSSHCRCRCTAQQQAPDMKQGQACLQSKPLNNRKKQKEDRQSRWAIQHGEA